MTFRELIDSTNTELATLAEAINVDASTLTKWYKHGDKPHKYLRKDIDRFFGRKIDLEYQPMFLPTCKHKGCYNEYDGKCMLLSNTLGYEKKCPFYYEDAIRW